jgi:hypothetical protein
VDPRGLKLGYPWVRYAGGAGLVFRRETHTAVPENH